MRVYITEKPDVARNLAALIGATRRCDGYLEGDGIQVTWTYGHLCCLYEPNDYKPEWKHWTLSSLPMIPPKFDIKLIDIDNYKRQMGVIKKLFAGADEIVNCGDAGQEGELIQRWVMKYAGAKCPVKRLWTSSLTDEALLDALSKIKPQEEYDRLFYAGLSRAIGDWILGMNATRLYTLKYAGARGQILSIGRVQTPTLALIVKRQKEIAEFVPKDTWELHTMYRDVNFTSTDERFDTEAAANAAVQELTGTTLTIDSVEKKKGREAPPRLFDLTSLQVECNKKFSWTAEQTLKLIQSLYEKKLTTYPRVDTTYLPDDVYPKIAPTLQKMTPYAPLTAPILAKPITKSKKIFDNAKVTDHHAIIPTGQSPASLQGDEKRLYHLIAMRFIAAFYPDCTFQGTTVLAKALTYEFKATGKVIIDPGWRAIYADKKDDADDSKESDDADRILPEFTQGESGPHAPFTAKKTSQPPKYYNEGTLLRAMETAGRTVDSEELREALKENGIGRPSTRANIIETLFKRRYIFRAGKTIQATQAGIDLIDTINEELLKSAALTGIWENKLRQIERGDYSAPQFIREISVLIHEIVRNVLSDNSNRRIVASADESKSARSSAKAASGTKTPASVDAPKKPRAPRITKLEQVECPLCGKGHMLKGRTAFGCSRYAEGCTYRLPFEQCPPDTTPAQIKKLISKKK